MSAGRQGGTGTTTEAKTLSRLLRDLAAEHGDAEALVYPAFTHGGEEIRLTFAQLDARVDDIARGLIAIGIAAGDHVAVWGGNVPDWVPMEFALARVGAVLVTVNTALKKDEVAFVLKQSRSVAVVHTTATGTNESSRTLDELLEAGDPSVAAIRNRIWMPSLPDEEPPFGIAPDGGHAALGGVENLIDRGRDLAPEQLAEREAATKPDDVVNIQYTSGTTGFPKGVMLSHANIVVNSATLGRQMGLTADDRVAMIVPLFHCFGCVVAVLGTYSVGATLCAIPGFEPGAALRLLEEEHCTIVHGVPTMFTAMLAHEDMAKRRISTLRAGLAAGAPCPVPLMKEIVERLGCNGIAVTYGLTEASPGVAGSVPDAPLETRCQTIGKPLDGVEVLIAEPGTVTPVPDGQEGELLCRGPNVMVGYFENPEATAAAITPEGWLRTGDLCVRDEDGNLRISGRLKDIIIRGGENIAPAAVESVLREHPDIVEAAVVGVPDEVLGEKVAAGLILKQGAELDPPAYEELLADRVAKFKIPEIWKTFEAFPLTGSGKVQKFRLREMFDA
ncbi:MAG: AMP-binding protein [Planctomycetota bacterium]|jgi:fatty-acyl-CoA synthase